jgi:integrase
VQKIENPIRRDYFLWLAFTGSRRRESAALRWENVDFKNCSVHFAKTKTVPFDLPLSNFLLELLKRRRDCMETEAVYGKDNPWLFPAIGKLGHIVEPKLTAKEEELFQQTWSPHVLRHTWISIAENKVTMPATHARLLVNHVVGKGDAHVGYIHADLEDLRRSQEMMSDYLLTMMKPKLVKSKKRSKGNVVPFKRVTASR